MSRPDLYDVWKGILRRCYNSAHVAYENYGGRGIYVCEAWKASFEQFCKDMGPRPNRTDTIDRIDNDGPYTPDNCRWVSKTEQNLNKRPRVITRVHTEDNISLTIPMWAIHLGVTERAIWRRLQRKNSVHLSA